MKKKEGAAGNPRARPASTGGLSLLPPPPGGKTSTLIPPPGEQLSVGGSLVQPAVAPTSGQCSVGDCWIDTNIGSPIWRSCFKPQPNGECSNLESGRRGSQRASAGHQELFFKGGASVPWPQPKPATAATADIWGDFTKSTGN
ncbi:hypothetical protein P7K49_015536 [Saguinus oedipus]|uniref:Uncharacterized protein n=1 Tax=Saguinus oedipus TaxID=9490 RepID=A0ABQ9V9H5_SAGOE|nr:hypothetical protein P7K49_015536 [Saguinus oedipus]